MAYNPQANLLNASISQDTQGIAPGITAAGNAFAGALQTYGQNKRADARRVEDRQWQQEDNQTAYARQDARDNKLFARQDAQHQQLRQEQLADYGMRKDDAMSEKAQKKQEEADAADGILAGQMALFGKYMTPETAAATQRMSPKAKMEFATAFAGYGAQRHREETAAEAAAALERQRQTPPAAWNVSVPGVPGVSIYGVENSAMGTYGNKTAGPTPEQLQRFGLLPKSATVNGVEYGTPPVPPPNRLIRMRDSNGKDILVDSVTGRPPAASKTAGSYYQKHNTP